MERPLIIYHSNCADGFTAAWVAYRKLGPDCEFFPAQYGQEPPDVADRSVYILDFSYKRPVMEKLGNDSSQLIVLDHHKSAVAELEGLYEPWLHGRPAPKIVFDMEKSGARLAWEHFFPNKRASWIIDYTEDRDLWRWQLPFSREVSAAIASYPWTFKQWDEWNLVLDPLTRGLAEQGKAIERYKTQQVDNICRNAHEIELDGYKVLTVNTGLLISEVGEKLADGRPFSATWFELPDGSRVWSLRSRGDGVDVSEIAKKRGGGGHRNAAGFTAKE